MINWKLISKIMGILLFIEAGLMFLCLIVGYIYGDPPATFAFPILIAAVIGSAGVFFGRNAPQSMGRRDG